MIVSPEVPVFRDDEDRLIEDPWSVTTITSPSPNAGAVAKDEPAALGEVAAAVEFGQTALVLGAWGCGVFKNDPETVARLFAKFLHSGGDFARAFEHVAFAVLDREGSSYAAFAGVFGGAAPPAYSSNPGMRM